MKKALISKIENDRICEVRNFEDIFEVSSDFEWIDCPDNITNHYTYDRENNSFKEFDMINVPGFRENGYKVARQIAYGNIGDQLDMIFKEITATGVISVDGPWATLIASVKNEIPKDNPEAVQVWNIQWNEKTSVN